MRVSRSLPAVVGAALLGAHIFVVFAPGDGGLLVVGRDVIPIAVPVAAGVVCLIVGRRAPASSRLTWIFFALGALAWAAGDALFSIYSFLDIDPTMAFTAADFGYLALIPLWMAALLVHPSRSTRSLDRLGTTIDAAAIVVVVSALTITYVLRPTIDDAENVAGLIVALAYPVADLALLVLVVSARARSADRYSHADLLITGALATFAIGDIAYARLAIVGDYYVGHPVDLAWTIAFVTLILAAGRMLSQASFDQRQASIPVLSVFGALAMVTITVLAVAFEPAETILLLGAAITGCLLIVRLGVLLVDRARIVDALDLKVVELEEARAARERFIATVSHDLRSPLASIVGFAELLGEPGMVTESQQVADITSSIERNARRLARLTEDLLCAGQFASGHPPPLKLAAVDLHELAGEVVNDLQRGDHAKIEGKPWTYALADRQRVEQILTNLLDNALKHSGSKEVTIRVWPSEDGAVLEVSDRGVGIAPEKIGQIFDPFVSDFKRASSAGLGLYVVASLVKAMRGRISVTSELNVGTTFKVMLPAAVSDPEVVGAETLAASGE